MKLIDLVTGLLRKLTGGAPQVGNLRQLLVAGGEALPDLKDEADAAIAALDMDVSGADVVAAGETILEEGKAILSGKVVARDHPSDLGG